jgi:PAS domain S-box-containing protein
MNVDNHSCPIETEPDLRHEIIQNPNPILRLGQDGRILYANPAGHSLLRAIAAAGSDESACLPPEWQAAVSTALASGTPGEIEIDAGARTYRFTLVPVPDERCVVGYGVDVTRQKQNEADLREYEERNRLLFENSMDGILLTMPDGSILSANPAACRMFGRTEEEICRLGRGSVVDMTDPRVLAAIEERRRTGRFNTEMPLLRADGTRFPGEVSSIVFKGHDGRLRTSMIARDISERKKREEELHRLNRTLRAYSRSSKALMHASNETEYLSEVCRIIVEDCGHAMVWIGFAENDMGQTVRPVAHAGFEAGYLETLHITWADTERGRGPTGTAIRTGKVAACNHMLTDPQFAPWRAEAVRRGFASSLVLPLVDSDAPSDHSAFGAVTIYSREPDPFSQDEVELLSDLANDLAYGIQTLRLRAAHNRSAAALRESENRYHSLFNRMTEGFALHEIICDDQGVPVDFRYLDVNPAFERLTGLRREDVVGLTHNEVLPDDSRHWVQEYGAVALTGVAIQFDDYVPALRRHYEILAYQPAPRQFAVIFMDVTARAQAEERLTAALSDAQQRGAETETTFAALSDVVLIYDTDRQIVKANPRFRETFGFDPLGLNVAQIIQRVSCRWLDGRPFLLEDQPTPRALRGEIVTGARFLVKRTTGDDMIVETSSSPLRMGSRTGDEIFGSVTVWHDITEREQLLKQVQASSDQLRQANDELQSKAEEMELVAEELRVQYDELMQAQEALSRNEALLRAVTENSPDAIFLKDRDSRVLLANPATLAVVGKPAGQVIGKTDEEFYDDPATGRAIMQNDRRVMESGQAQVIEEVVPKPDGLHTYQSTKAPLRDASGRIIGIVGVAHDITERKQVERERERRLEAEALARREAERANELKSKFLAMISHELRTPLSSIKGFASTLLATDVVWDPVDQHDFIQTINAEADKLTELIDQLLDLSRIQAGTLRVNTQHRQIHEIIAAATPQLDFLTRHHVLRVAASEDLPGVNADPQRIGQVLANLVGNAAKYSPPGTSIAILARQAGDCIEVSVSDQGPGVAASERPHLFEVFNRGSDQRVERVKGAGLGLAICKGLIEAHGGRIWLADHAGHGAIFAFTLPIAM